MSWLKFENLKIKTTNQHKIQVLQCYSNGEWTSSLRMARDSEAPVILMKVSSAS